MVIVKLKGGLGNQMFQYALGRRIAWVNNVPLKLDLSWFENVGNDTSRKYELKHLKIKEQFASKDEIRNVVKGVGLFNNFGRLGRKLLPLTWRNYITERNTGFDPAIMKLRDNIYLEGVWGNEKYFLDIQDLIKEEFRLRTQQAEVNVNMTKLIDTVDSVAIHVRRGDYVSNPITNRYHGLCPKEYYLYAVSEITKKIKKPHFFLFSDDPQWVKDNIKISYPTTYVNHNSPEHGYEDLQLMRICKHAIIANSSFSWWAAWLNANPNKIIYAPSKWSNNHAATSSNFLPQQWITL